MTARNRVEILEEAAAPATEEGWRLCLHWCSYRYADGTQEEGYRLIWRRPDGRLQPARGQARLPSLDMVRRLFDQADREGWGRHAGPGNLGTR